MCHIASPAVAFRNRQRLHQMPTRKIGARDVADLPAANERIECLESLLNRRQFIETMHVVDVDVIRTQAAQAGLARTKNMMARRPNVVRITSTSTTCMVSMN